MGWLFWVALGLQEQQRSAVLERPAADRFRARALCGIWLGVYGFLTRILGASRRFRLALPARSRPQHHQAKKPHFEMLSKNGLNSI